MPLRMLKRSVRYRIPNSLDGVIMNKQTKQHLRREQTHSSPDAHRATNGDVQVATETMYKVAEVSRTLKCVNQVVESWVHLASNTNAHLSLLHCLVLVRLSRSPTCKQVDIKSDTKIAPAYLTRLLDDLTKERLVRRHRSSTDRRQILLTLTEHGKDTARELLTSLNNVTQPSQLDAIEHLASSLDQFVSFVARENGAKNKV
jgi:DNA-binding MarR family transcriptional regulator